MYHLMRVLNVVRSAIGPTLVRTADPVPRRSLLRFYSTKAGSHTRKTGARQHILRDRMRVEKFKRSIRKVTSEIPPTPKDENKPTVKVHSAFAELNVMGPLLRAVDELGYVTPSEVQKAMIPLAIRGANIVSSAKTGTGKTAAYGIPLLQRLHSLKAMESRGKLPREPGAPLAVIVCPTRELCEQVEMHIYKLAKYIPGMRIIGLQGAMRDVNTQAKEIEKGVDILVATPGRLIKLIRPRDATAAAPKIAQGQRTIVIDDDFIYEEIDTNVPAEEEAEIMDDLEEAEEHDDDYFDDEDAADVQEYGVPASNTRVKISTKADDKGEETVWDQKIRQMTPPKKRTPKDELAPSRPVINLAHVKVVVLDEVDRMLAMGHLPEVKAIFQNLPKISKHRGVDAVQVMMCSATLIPRIRDLVIRFAPNHNVIDLNKAMEAASDVKQFFFAVGPARKKALLEYLLRRRTALKEQQTLVFCRTKQRVDRLVAGLKESGFRAEALHGEMTLARRSKLVEAFQNSEFQILVSTDLLSRGIDIPNLPAVVNFDLPHNPEDYIHRIGRTGRAGAPGKAYSFISKDRSTVELGGYVVEIDESVFLSKISELLNKSLHVTKVPGPWRDQARERNKPVEGETQVTETEGAESREYYQTDVTEPLEPLDSNDPLLVKMAKETVSIPKKSLEERKRQFISQLKDKALRVERSITPPEEDSAGRRRLRKGTTIGQRSDIHAARVKAEPKLRDFQEGRYEDLLNRFDKRRARKLGIHVPVDIENTLDKKRKRIQKRNKRERDRKHQAKNSK